MLSTEFWLGSESTSEYICSNGQQARHETVWIEEGAHAGEGETESCRTLDYPSLLQLQVR